jgi:hypothetical protein
MAGFRPRVGMLALPTVISLLLVAGCDDLREQPRLISARLYVGLAHGGAAIPAAELDGFIDAVITPWFPGGLTVYRTDSQWQSAENTVIKEKTAVIELIYPDDQEQREHLLEIIERYKQRFHQRSVLLVVSGGSMSLR